MEVLTNVVGTVLDILQDTRPNMGNTPLFFLEKKESADLPQAPESVRVVVV